MPADQHEGLDGLQADMAAHQARFRGEVTAESNRALAATEIERAERINAEAKEPAPVVADSAPAPDVDSCERRDVDGKRYIVSKRTTDDTLTRSATPAEQWFMEHAMPRIELLLTKLDTGPMGQPSWNQRVMAVIELKSREPGLRLIGLHASADDINRRYMAELMIILEESSSPFGDWKKDPERKIYG